MNVYKFYLHVSVDDFSVDFSIPDPPGDGGIGDGRGDAGQVHWVLVPAPLLVHRLLLERGSELNLNKS